ncbi:phage portal protein [Sporosarcina saromensis]|uniref:Phage portal protein n=1 Tax=Sporosarcina saromensis TaxID=359365 RepID=A0ABU4G9Y8_9BACL|nr:phage portal protein [Sporosarcina saromensis]MDW0113775.1 phage portal protein [Sporosarcina saromensis]
MQWQHSDIQPSHYADRNYNGQTKDLKGGDKMTIIYEKNKFPPAPFDVDYENMHYYRDLYEGNHKEIFPRAQQIVEQSQQSARTRLRNADRRQIVRKKSKAETTLNNYVVVNFSSAIAELPADLINRSLGNISADEEKDKDYLDFVTMVSRVSNTKSALWAAIVQHQVDGGVAYRVRRTERKGTWFEWLPADLYFQHDDELGADITWTEERGNETYLRVERQRLEDVGLVVSQHVYLMKGDAVDSEIDFTDYNAEHGLNLEPIITLEGVNELMSGYLANDETLLQPRGRSALRNIDGIQEEINWTITRDSIVFEKHGKPKLAIPRKLWDTVANQNNANYGGRFVRNADLEVVSYDENNGAVPMYITWDAQTAQSFEHVTRLIDYMMAISKTAATAVGLGDAGGSLSAKAILYEWIQSVIKAEAIQEKFDHAIKGAIRKCTILENHFAGTDYEVKDPIIEWKGMLPKADAESDEEESKKYTDGVQSLETTIRNLHPDWSEEAIKNEIEKIQNEQMVDGMNPTFIQPPKTNIGDDE